MSIWSSLASKIWVEFSWRWGWFGESYCFSDTKGQLQLALALPFLPVLTVGVMPGTGAAILQSWRGGQENQRSWLWTSQAAEQMLTAACSRLFVPWKKWRTLFFMLAYSREGISNWHNSYKSFTCNKQAKNNNNNKDGGPEKMSQVTTWENSFGCLLSKQIGIHSH